MTLAAEWVKTVRRLAALPKSALSRKLLWLYAHGDRSADLLSDMKKLLEENMSPTPPFLNARNSGGHKPR